MAAKYTLTFTSNTGENCVLTINDSTYNGAVIPIQYYSGKSPVVRTHEASGEGIFSPIVASSLDVAFINDGTVSVEDFLTDDNSRFTCELVVDGVSTWKGVLSINDLSEKVIYTPNEVKLLFTDGLGLLKNYTIADCDLSPLSGRYRFTAILTSLLKLTGLELPLNTFCNAYETQMANRTAGNQNDPFYQSGINIKTFLQNSSDEDKWESVYEALEKIMAAWQCSIFQEGAKWQVVRKTEIVNNPAGTAYNTAGSATAALSNQFPVNSDLTAIERSQIKTFERAARKIIRTFKFRYPQLLKNANLQRVGNLRGTTVDGSNTIYRYDVADMTLNGTQDAEIRVVRNTTTGREVERYLYLYFSSDTTAQVVFTPIEVDQGDNFNLTWRHRAATDSNFTGIFRFGLFLDSYTGSDYLLQGIFLYATWQTTASTASNWVTDWGYPYRGADDLTQYRTQGFNAETDVDYEMEFPADGLFYIGFNGWNNNLARRADVDAIISDIKFEYVKYLVGGQSVTGHEHAIEQGSNNKADEQEVFLDDSPATSIKGTLFFIDGSSVPNRADSWSDDETNFYRFGELMTTRQMELQGVTRYNLEGSFYGIASMLNRYQFSFFTGRTFYPTRLTVDYARGITDATFTEIDGPDSVGSSTYTFRYLYD